MIDDNDIKRALECCVKDDEGKNGFCNENCPLFGEGYICADFLRSKTLDLIKRQQAEIERLTVNKNACALGMKRLSEQLETAKSEAIKEFTERLKERAYYIVVDEKGLLLERKVVNEEAIDYLVKEMTEVKNNE